MNIVAFAIRITFKVVSIETAEMFGFLHVKVKDLLVSG